MSELKKKKKGKGKRRIPIESIALLTYLLELN